MYHFFKRLNQVIIIFSILVIIFGILTKLDKKSDVSSFKPTPTPIPTPAIKNNLFDDQLKNFLPTPKLDPNFFWYCQFNQNQATATAFIKDKDFLLKINKDKNFYNVLWLKNCFYVWEEGKKQGEKFCQVESVFKFLGLKIESLPAELILPLFGFEFKEEFCKKQEQIPNFFKIPSRVNFKEIN